MIRSSIILSLALICSACAAVQHRPPVWSSEAKASSAIAVERAYQAAALSIVAAAEAGKLSDAELIRAQGLDRAIYAQLQRARQLIDASDAQGADALALAEHLCAALQAMAKAAHAR
jgi:hypothetical protein